MKKLASKRKETESAARLLDALRKRATPKERVSSNQAIQMANLNIFERGEIVDFKDVYFCGTANAPKHVGELSSDLANFGYDDERGDYSIAVGDHLSYRYEIVDILGKGSFGQVVRCIDHKTGGLVAIKIIRNKKRFHQQALVEVNILQKLREWVSLAIILFRIQLIEIGSKQQTQHGQLCSKLLFQGSSLHLNRTPGYELVRVYQIEQLSRFLAQGRSTFHQAAS